MVRPVPAHAAATSCTVPSPPTATTDTSSGSPRTILPACPGFSVTCQTGRNPRSSKNRETDARSPPARPLPADGLRTRCASPPKENIAGKYQNRSPAALAKGRSGSTRGVDCDESRPIPARSKERPKDGGAETGQPYRDCFAGRIRSWFLAENYRGPSKGACHYRLPFNIELKSRYRGTSCSL